MLREALQQGTFVISCEFVPGRGKSGPAVDAAATFARDMVASGTVIHAVSLTDNPGGNPAISPDILGREVQENGLDALVHFSCRDLNRNAFEARAMALARSGVNNVLVLTGDYTESGYEGKAMPVFDLDSVQAIRYLKAMNAGIEVPGPKKGTTARLPATNFFIGAAVSPFKSKEEELIPQFYKLEKKIAAGADFIVPQLGYDMRRFLEIKRFMASRGLTTPLFGNVYVLSAGAAKAMYANKVPGCVVSRGLVTQLEEEAKAPDKGKAARLERAAKMVAMFRGMGFNGVHIGGFALKTADFQGILARATELQPRWQEFIPEVSFSEPGEFYAFPPPPRYDTVPKDAPVETRLVKRSGSFAYGYWLFMHSLLFKRGSLGYKLMCAYYRMLGEKGFFARASHGIELLSKMLFFGCRDCGDCALPDLAYCCPQSQCAKQQRNGACGGGKNGWCEVYPDEKPCVWTIVYRRLRDSGTLEEMRTNYVPPRRAALEHTSGWGNYYLNKDHAAEPAPVVAPTPAAPAPKDAAPPAAPAPPADAGTTKPKSGG